MTFLTELTRRPLSQTIQGLSPQGLYIGPGDLGLEVAVYDAESRPTARLLQDAWKARRGTRATPLLVVVLYGGTAWVCGPTGENLPIQADKDPRSIERLCTAALKQPDRHAALIFLAQALPSLETPAPGLRNEGLFALHELTNDAPRRPEWKEHQVRARAAIGSEGHDLLRKLGFTIDRLDNLTLLLKGADRRLALAVLLDQSEVPESGSPRFSNLSPVSYAFTKADSENLDWVVAVQGDRLRLYPTRTDVGVGRRGRTETYIELQTSLLSDEHAAYLSLLFSADALKPGGTVQRLLDDSRRFAVDLAKRLRERIYESVVPLLAQGMATARNLKKPTAEDLDLTYRMALTVLFRLLFVAYAEDRDLLPYQQSEAYRNRSLKRKAQELSEHMRFEKPITPGTSHWDEVTRIWTAIERGDAELSVPAYNGGLFTRDPAVSKAGAALAKLKLPNEVVEPALKDLLLIDLEPVDFRSLGVREFGTIYEGLLESELSVADQDLALDAKGSYIPVRAKMPPVVREGEIYLHNKSGARKSSGSYFTKSFAVEHLLDRALIPALADHLTRVSTMDDAGATQAFFDFRVADIAMGSGHFLVAAIDRIEKSFTDYLAKPGAKGASGVRAELLKLKEAAKAQLGDLADQMTFEDSQLLRRLIARRCIYGVDFSPLSVELARLSIWIHTFVPGLPLSVLDHNLVNGNALVGVATIDEIKSKFEAAGTSLFPVDANNLLGQAERPLKRLANLSDSTLADVAKARDAMEEARIAVGDTQALCDIITAQGLDAEIKYQFENWETERSRVQGHPARRRAAKTLDGLKPFHFPIAFPEVFLRKRAGFDALIGNPPWEKVHVEEHEFWARHFPGLRGLSQREFEPAVAKIKRGREDLVELLQEEVSASERLRKVLLSSPAFPGLGAGHADLYKAFCWRFWALASSNGGQIGIVLPRSAFSAKGSELFRKTIFEAADIDLTVVLNRAGWVFDDAEHRYTMCFVAIRRGEPSDKNVALLGPFADLESFVSGHTTPPARFAGREVLSWNEEASLPLLPTAASLDVFAQLRKAPRLDLDDGFSWRARSEQELNSTTQKPLMDLKFEKARKGYWPVFKGESFDMWNPDTGRYYAFADSRLVVGWLFDKRLRSASRKSGGVHGEFSPEVYRDKKTLSCLWPRLAYRRISRATDTRTVRAALVPPNVFLTDVAPVVHWPRGDQMDQAFLLGCLSSLALDWYARRFVETHLDGFIFNPLPIPRPPRTDVRWQRVVALAGRLAAADDRFADWAKNVGVKCGPLTPSKKQDMVDELDAVVAKLYGLTEPQLIHLFQTFHEGWDYEPRLQAVLKHFNA